MADLKEKVKELYEKVQEYAREAENIDATIVEGEIEGEPSETEINAFVYGAIWAFEAVLNTFDLLGVGDLIEKENEHEEPKAEGEGKKE